jgi:hypothetical protein
VTAEFDTRALDALAVDLGKMSDAVHRQVRGVFQEGASDLKKEWQANAKESAGTHGRLYPYSIDWEERVSTNLDFEVGPNDGKSVAGGNPGQAGEGYEYGSVNQPPHLDGNRAADRLIPLIERRIVIAAEGLFDA